MQRYTIKKTPIRPQSASQQATQIQKLTSSKKS
jgi:hypothetical protein